MICTLKSNYFSNSNFEFKFLQFQLGNGSQLTELEYLQAYHGTLVLNLITRLKNISHISKIILPWISRWPFGPPLFETRWPDAVWGSHWPPGHRLNRTLYVGIYHQNNAFQMWSRCYIGTVWLIIFMSCDLKSGPFRVQNIDLTSIFIFKH